MRRNQRSRHAWLYASPLLAVMACGMEPGDPLEPESDRTETTQVDEIDIGSTESAVIENTEDWDWIGFHSQGNDPAFNLFSSSDVRNSVRAANGIARIGGCTAFLVAPDIIMTADHCFRSNAGVLSANITTTATFLAETSTPRMFTCRGPLHNDPAADLITLRCDRDAAGLLPGNYVTPVRMSAARPFNGTDLFSITYNCRCDDWTTGCTTVGVGGTKWRLAPGGMCTGSPAGNNNMYRLLSPGGLGQTHNSRFKNCEVNNSNATWSSDSSDRRGFAHNCDILPGSSGGPVFNRFNGSVIGILSHQWHTGGTYNQSGEAWRWMALADKNNNGFLTVDERNHKFRWLNWTSDGKPAALCQPGWGATGFECKGNYCDDVRLLCQPIPNASGTMRWSGWFSEENSGSQGCNSNEVVSGVQCSGNYCDNLRFRCSRLSSPAVRGSCSTSASVSEETAPLATLNNAFIQRATCTGSYCDNKRFTTCAINVPGRGTCLGRCGGRATGTGWCDAACDGFGDCAGDVNLMCR